MPVVGHHRKTEKVTPPTAADLERWRKERIWRKFTELKKAEQTALDKWRKKRDKEETERVKCTKKNGNKKFKANFYSKKSTCSDKYGNNIAKVEKKKKKTEEERKQYENDNQKDLKAQEEIEKAKAQTKWRKEATWKKFTELKKAEQTALDKWRKKRDKEETQRVKCTKKNGKYKKFKAHVWSKKSTCSDKYRNNIAKVEKKKKETEEERKQYENDNQKVIKEQEAKTQKAQQMFYNEYKLGTPSKVQRTGTYLPLYGGDYNGYGATHEALLRDNAQDTHYVMLLYAVLWIMLLCAICCIVSVVLSGCCYLWGQYTEKRRQSAVEKAYKI